METDAEEDAADVPKISRHCISYVVHFIVLFLNHSVCLVELYEDLPGGKLKTQVTS